MSNLTLEKCSNISPDEFVRFFLAFARPEEIETYFTRFIEEGVQKDKELELTRRDLELTQESLNNALTLLEEVKVLIDQQGKKQELVKAIKLAYENSYVEL
jgi:hypothetical protein